MAGESGWTLVGIDGATGRSQYVDLASVERFGGERSAIKVRSVVDPSLPLANMQVLPNADVDETFMMFECNSMRWVFTHETVYDNEGKTIYTYDWGDPSHLDFALGGSVTEGSTFENIRRLACNEKLQKPFITKADTEADFARLNLTYLQSSTAGNGKLFYGPSLEGTNERLFVNKLADSVPLSTLLGPDAHVKVLGAPGTFKYVVQDANVDCSSSKFSYTKLEYYDEKFERVCVLTSNSEPVTIIPTSPAALLKSMVCPQSKDAETKK